MISYDMIVKVLFLYIKIKQFCVITTCLNNIIFCNWFNYNRSSVVTYSFVIITASLYLSCSNLNILITGVYGSWRSETEFDHKKRWLWIWSKLWGSNFLLSAIYLLIKYRMSWIRAQNGKKRVLQLGSLSLTCCTGKSVKLSSFIEFRT